MKDQMWNTPKQRRTFLLANVPFVVPCEAVSSTHGQCADDLVGYSTTKQWCSGASFWCGVVVGCTGIQITTNILRGISRQFYILLMAYASCQRVQ